MNRPLALVQLQSLLITFLLAITLSDTAKTPLAPYRFARRDPRPDDVVIDILHCGAHTYEGLKLTDTQWIQTDLSK